MKKIVINRCYGGFGLSPLAIKELAKLNNTECYFFINDVLVDINQCDGFGWSAYSVKEPNFLKMSTKDSNGLYVTANEYAESISIDSTTEDRSCSKLISVIEKLGDKANGPYSKLAIVEIPEDVEYTIEEYDGNEWVAEAHRTWH